MPCTASTDSAIEAEFGENTSTRQIAPCDIEPEQKPLPRVTNFDPNRVEIREELAMIRRGRLVDDEREHPGYYKWLWLRPLRYWLIGGRLLLDVSRGDSSLRHTRGPSTTIRLLTTTLNETK